MNLSLPQYSPRKWLSPTALQTLARCPRKFFYQYGLRLVASTEEGLALKFGEAIHNAIPHAYNADLSEALKAFSVVWGDRDNLGDDKRNTTRAYKMLKHFSGTHNKEFINYQLIPPPRQPDLVTVDSVSDNEVAFAVDIGVDIPLVGRIDGFARDIHTGHYWAVEYKTTSELGSRFLQSFEINPQIYAYTLALRTISGITVQGVILEALLVAKSSENSQSNMIYVSDDNLEDFVSWVQWLYSQLLSFEKSSYFPKNLSACNTYASYGSPGYNCPYLELCKTKDWTKMVDLFLVADEKPFILFSGASDAKPTTTTTVQNV